MAKRSGRGRPARWAPHDAKNRFSEVVDAALRGKPQIVTRRGVETAAVISHDEYARMTEERRARRRPLADYIAAVPRGGDEADPFERILLRSRTRD